MILPKKILKMLFTTQGPTVFATAHMFVTLKRFFLEISFLIAFIYFGVCFTYQFVVIKNFYCRETFFVVLLLPK